MTLSRTLVLVVLLGAACERPPSGDDVRDGAFAGVPERELVEVLRLGGPEAPEEARFQAEPHVAVHRSGLVHVLHAQQGRVAVLDSTGRLVRWIGGRGEGPGEFEIAMGLGFVGDTLWIRNFPTPRISRFRLDGTHLSTERSPYDFGYRLTAPSGLSGYLARGRAWAFADAFVIGQDTAVQMPFLVGDRAMRRPDTLFTAANPRGRLAGLRFDPVPQPPFHAVAPTGDRVAVAHWHDDEPGTVRVRVYAPEGAETASWTLDFPVIPLDDAARDSVLGAGVEAIEQLAVRLREQGIPENAFRATISRSEVEAEVYLPAHYPPVRGIRLGHDGTVWIATADGLDEGPWLVLDARGEALFRVDVPEGVTVRAVSGATIWATERDALDVPYLVRYDVRPASRPVDGGA